MRMAKCSECDKTATWFYQPAGEEVSYCDECVPRGCSCNILPGKEEEEVDEQGRLMPCCEYSNEPDGRDLDLPPPTDAQVEQLELLWQLWNQEKITDEEYEARHKEIINPPVNK